MKKLIDSQATRTKVANTVYCSKVVSESVGIGATSVKPLMGLSTPSGTDDFDP
jgi:hypothetical protein